MEIVERFKFCKRNQGETESATVLIAEQNYAQIEQEAIALIFAVHRLYQYVYGRPFTLVTDHHPLCKILGEKEGIPPLTAARIQWRALLLSAHTYQYKKQHVPGKQNHCVDCMSCLPDPHEKCDSAEKVHSVVMTEQLSVFTLLIAKPSEKDKELATVIAAVQLGRWPSNSNKSFTPYYSGTNDLTVWADAAPVRGCICP